MRMVSPAEMSVYTFFIDRRSGEFSRICGVFRIRSSGGHFSLRPFDRLNAIQALLPVLGLLGNDLKIIGCRDRRSTPSSKTQARGMQIGRYDEVAMAGSH